MARRIAQVAKASGSHWKSLTSAEPAVALLKRNTDDTWLAGVSLIDVFPDFERFTNSNTVGKGLLSNKFTLRKLMIKIDVSMTNSTGVNPTFPSFASNLQEETTVVRDNNNFNVRGYARYKLQIACGWIDPEMIRQNYAGSTQSFFEGLFKFSNSFLFTQDTNAVDLASRKRFQIKKVYNVGLPNSQNRTIVWRWKGRRSYHLKYDYTTGTYPWHLRKGWVPFIMFRHNVPFDPQPDDIQNHGLQPIIQFQPQIHWQDDV